MTIGAGFSLRVRRVSGKIGLTIATTLLADFLFYAHPLGGYAALYSLALLCATAFCVQGLFAGWAGRFGALLCGAFIGAQAFDPGFLGFLLFGLTFGALIVRARSGCGEGVSFLLRGVGAFLSGLFSRPSADNNLFVRVMKKRPMQRKNDWVGPFLRASLLSVLFCFVFVALFARANPLIRQALVALDFRVLWQLFSVWRWAYWALFAALGWSAVRARFTVRPVEKSLSTFRADWFPSRGLVFSLLAFNAIFLVQNSLDVAVLFGLADLPSSVSLAEYARTGAYPLIFTTLLAAFYVLVLFGQSGRAEVGPTARGLVVFWILQNLFLIGSAWYRLVGLVSCYALTSLRFYSFVWLVLVAGGFVFMALHIVREKSAVWLFNRNAVFLFVVLGFCSWIDQRAFIASYNVRHAREMGGEGVALDFFYLRRLGLDALPALIDVQKAAQAPAEVREKAATMARAAVRDAEARLAQDWRAATVKNKMLLREYGAAFFSPLDGAPASVKD